MGRVLMTGGGGGGDLDVITAEADDILSGKVIVDKDGNPLTGTLTLSGDAGAGDVLSGKTFYTTNPKSKQTGTMGTMGGGTYTPKAAQQTVSCSGKKMTGDIIIKGDGNLVAGNILNGKSIFGVAGNVRKYGYTSFASGPSGNRKTYNYYPNNSVSLYPLNLNVGFYPKAYGYVCYQAPSYNGIMNKYGTFRTHAGSSMYDIISNTALVNGTNLYLPCGTTGYTMDGCVGGYY